MKKAISSLLLLLTFAFMVAPAVFAAENELDLVTDAAYLLTDDEYWELNDRAHEVSEQYECEVLVVTLDDIGDDDPVDMAHYIYDTYDVGYGPKRSCLIFLLSMENRDYALVAFGYGNTAFTDYGKDVMLDKHVLPLLGKDKYYEAFSTYYDVAEEYLQMARSGAPFDKDTDPDYGKLGIPIKLGITLVVPILIAFVVCEIWRRQMKTAVLARDAGNYISQNGFVLTAQEDRFLYRTETRRKIEKSSSSGGTTIGSSGSSSRSGKF